MEKNWYDKSYKVLLIIPLLLLVLSIGYLWNFNSQNGDIIYKDVSLTGGTTVTVFDQNADVGVLKTSLESEFGDVLVRQLSDFGTGEQQGFFVEVSEEPEAIKSFLEQELGYKLTQENSSVEFASAGISQGFYQQLRLAILLSFLFMAIVVFLIFRTFIPSFAVILSAFSDIVMTIALVDILGIKVSIAGIIAFLMLIGYSVDTDILLTSRLLKKKDGTVNERLFGALKTGATMTITSIVAIGVALIVIFDLSDTLRQIFNILLIGLGFDLFNTWFANAGILKWYVEKKNGGSE
jgi:preprotein translocase subunit SecF